MKDNIFSELCDAINNYNRRHEFGEEERNEMLLSIIKCMCDFLKNIVKSGKFKDTFEYFYYPGICIETIAESNKNHTKYIFSYDLIEHEFFFQSYILHDSNLRHLEEDFLLEFFGVLKTHNIKYIQTEFCPEAEKNHPELFKNKKGNLLPLMRNYYLGTVYENNNDNRELSLGMFEVVWDVNWPVDEIFTEACVAMKWLYKFNYNLWKAGTLKQNIE